MLLTELGLLPLQVFWWQQTLKLYSKLAASPVDSLFHVILLDKICMMLSSVGCTTFCSSIFQSLATVGHCMPWITGVASAHDVPVVIALLQQHLQGTQDFDLYCPRVAPSVGVVHCTYHHRFMPYSKLRSCCHLPVPGRQMQRLWQFRLASHSLPIVTGNLSGGQHVDRTDRVCSHCGAHALANELHMVRECSALQPLRQQYAALFTAQTDTMRSFVAQQDHMQVSNAVLDCLDFLHI